MTKIETKVVTTEFIQQNVESLPADERICAICQEALQNPVIGHEHHFFHRDCAAGALSEKPACPSCRTPVTNAVGYADAKIVRDSAAQARADGARDVVAPIYIPRERTGNPAVPQLGRLTLQGYRRIYGMNPPGMTQAEIDAWSNSGDVFGKPSCTLL